MHTEPLMIPYCGVCLGHLGRWQKAANRNLVAANVLIWGVALGLVTHLPVDVLLAVPVLAAAYWYSASRGETGSKWSCATVGRASKAIWHRRQTYIFSFASQQYANLFQEMNEDSLTDPSLR